jgi:soluble lytic murein transglycosylase-like protein
LIAKLLISISLGVGGFMPPTSFTKHDIPEPVDVSASARCPQWWQIAVDAGWKPSLLPTLDYLMWRESRCNAGAHNTEDPMGGSRGLVQINGFWTPWLASRGIVSRSEGLFGPYRNLRSALAIYNYADARYDNGFGPWGL